MFIVAEYSIFLIASKIIWWILAKFMTEFGFSGWISRVHFVVNLLLVTVTMVACSIRRLYPVLLSFPVELSGPVLMLKLFFFMFFNVTNLKICF